MAGRASEKAPSGKASRACESWFLAGCGMRGARRGVAGLLAKLRGLRHDRDGREGELIASPGAGRGEARVLWPRWNVAPERLPLARVVLDAGCNGDYWQVQHQTARCVGLRHRTACAIERHHCSLRRRHSQSPVAIAAVAVAGTSRQQQRRDTWDPYRGTCGGGGSSI